MKRITFRIYPYPHERPLFTILEKPYVHTDFIPLYHRYQRYYRIYHNGQGEIQIYFNPRRFPDFNTICHVLSQTLLDDFNNLVKKLLAKKDSNRHWKKTFELFKN
jgi:hypothetical protein